MSDTEISTVTPQPADARTATAIHAERPHAERSASQLGSLARCPGFRTKPSPRIHWVTAQGNRGHAALDSGEDDGLESEFEEQMVSFAEASASSLPPCSRQFEELRVSTIEGRWGYTDRLRIRADHDGRDSDTADLIDWKFVRAHRVPGAEINLQGKDYVVGIFEDPQFAFLSTIHVHFVMPRFREVTTATFHRTDLPRLKLEILSILAAARDTDRTDYAGDTLRPAYDVCTYCGAAGNCVALRRIADGIARQYAAETHASAPAIPAETHASRVADPAARAQLQRLAGLMDVWAKSVRHHNLTAALESDANLPEGYELEWSKARRYVTDVGGLQVAAEEFGLSVPDLLSVASVRWTALEDIIKSRAPRGAKASSVAAFSQRLLELGAVERPEPTPQLRSVAK